MRNVVRSAAPPRASKTRATAGSRKKSSKNPSALVSRALRFRGPDDASRPHYLGHGCTWENDAVFSSGSPPPHERTQSLLRSSLPLNRTSICITLEKNGARLTRTEIRNVEVIPRNARYSELYDWRAGCCTRQIAMRDDLQRGAKHNTHIESESRRRTSSSRRFIFRASFISLLCLSKRPETF